MFPASVNAGALSALLLGLATGPVCLASCGPAVVPWILTQPQGLGRHLRQLRLFLAARLAAYLIFAVAVWSLGSVLLRSFTGRTWATAAIDLLLAAALAVYAAASPHSRLNPFRRRQPLVQIGLPTPAPPRGAVALGFLTGINLCPPFLVAGVQAAQQSSLPLALLFFLFFFVGTALWFVPFAAFGLLRRSPSLILVARLTAVLFACWYGFTGLTILIERILNG